MKEPEHFSVQVNTSRFLFCLCYAFMHHHGIAFTLVSNAPKVFTNVYLKQRVKAFNVQRQRGIAKTKNYLLLKCLALASKIVFVERIALEGNSFKGYSQYWDTSTKNILVLSLSNKDGIGFAFIIMGKETRVICILWRMQ